MTCQYYSPPFFDSVVFTEVLTRNLTIDLARHRYLASVIGHLRVVIAKTSLTFMKGYGKVT